MQAHVDRPVVSIPFRTAITFRVDRPEGSGKEWQHSYHLDSNEDCFEVLDERKAFNSDFVVVCAKRPYGEAVLNYALINEKGQTVQGSVNLRAVPSDRVGEARIEFGPPEPLEKVLEEIKASKPKQAQAPKQDEKK